MLVSICLTAGFVASLLTSGADCRSVFAEPRKFDGRLNHQLRSRGILTPHVDDAKPQFFSQVLDHFDNSNVVSWQQKYFVNDSVWDKPNGPVFIQLGGEGGISGSYVSDRLIMNTFAVEHRALVVGLEHRFYGDSIPNNDTSVQNLKFLSSQQALADVTTFIAHLRTQYSISPSARVVSFGGSYSGALSAWLRAKYPHLVHGAMAASAPILADLDFSEYLWVVADSLGATCSAKLSDGFEAAQQLLQTDDGRVKVEGAFNTCSNLSNTQDQSWFFELLTDSIASVVQYNDESGAGLDISKLCAQIVPIKDPLQALILAHQLISGKACMDASYTNYIASLQANSAMRSWTYQTCTEFGFYQTAEPRSTRRSFSSSFSLTDTPSPFPSLVNLALFVQQCYDLFGLNSQTVAQSIVKTNLIYGGKDIVTSNTVFTNGNIDPWHILSLTEPSMGAGLGQDSMVIYLNGTAHCADMYPDKANEVADLRAAHIVQREYLAKWLMN